MEGPQATTFGEKLGLEHNCRVEETTAQMVNMEKRDHLNKKGKGKKLKKGSDNIIQ